MRWLAVLAIVGCVEPGLVPCGDQLCPTGDSCVAGELCASAEQVAACGGLADNDACTVTGGAGRCERGVCVRTGCGNLVVDPDEACDDGNQASGDGCRADCKKIEQCGDAMVDDGEGCDDGNSNTADGCDACVPTGWNATVAVGGSANATKIGLGEPQALAIDRAGNVYIADNLGQRVVRVAANGFMSTVAGNGTQGAAGDGGPATNAQLDYPYGLAVDGLGNLYIASGDRVRRVNADGVISTVPGTSAIGYVGGMVVDGLGNLYVAASLSHRIDRIDPAGASTTVAGTGVAGLAGDAGAAVSAQLANPQGITLDGVGNLYIADEYNCRIRKVDAASKVITTIAGTTCGFSGDGGPATSAALQYPTAVATDDQGNVWIADRNNYRVRRVTAAGMISTVAGVGEVGFSGDGGPATSARFAEIEGIGVDGSGGAYLADAYNNRIRKVDPLGTISTFAGSGQLGLIGGSATSTPLMTPNALLVDALGTVVVADTENQLVRAIDTAGEIRTIAGNGAYDSGGDGGPASQAGLRDPLALARDSAGNLYIVDEENFRIRRIDTNGIITTVAGNGSPGFSGDGGPATDASLAWPSGIALTATGMYIADTDNHRIRRVDAAGIITTVAGTGVAGFSGDGGPAVNAQLNEPGPLAIDALGGILVTDSLNDVVRRLAPDGTITAFAGTGVVGFSGDNGPATSAQLSSPYGLAVDASGNVLIADAGNGRIRRVDTSGVITTIAGSGLDQLDGDGAAAVNATLASPIAVAVDAAGLLYIAEGYSNVVRRVSSTGVIVAIAGAIQPEGMGLLASAHLADPRALVRAASFSLVAGGTSGTIQAVRSNRIDAVAGRYPQALATGALARFRSATFGTIGGVAFDEASGTLYLTETTANRLHAVTVVDPANADTWTIATLANTSGTAGFADGAAATARFRGPTGLYLDPVAHQLYIADTGNHAIRALDLASGLASATVHTVAGTPATRGYFGDGGSATAALLYAPQAITRCTNGDIFIADTGNHRVRRLDATTHVITTVLGDGVAASSGEGRPARSFPVNAPAGLVCDPAGNVYVTSTTTVRMLPSDAAGVVDGTGSVQTIYGAAADVQFPANVTSCLTGIAVVDATALQLVDACTGLLIDLRRTPK